jgi:hypothetical protein
MIRHTVVFRLIHERGSQQEKDFLTRARKLQEISTVKNFECLRQVGTKNQFDFGLSMEFENQDGYDFYNTHPSHQTFLKDCWVPEVKEFMEFDYVRLE